MLADPLRHSELLPAAVAVQARADVRPQDSAHAESAAQLTKPASVSAPQPSDEVNVQWNSEDGVVLKFTDKISGEVVRQIPSEQVLSVARFIRQLLQEQGVAVDATLVTPQRGPNG